MSERTGLPPGEYNLPPGVSAKDIEGQSQWICEECGEELQSEAEIRIGKCEECFNDNDN